MTPVEQVLRVARSLRAMQPLPEVIDSIVLVGSTCSGKTTLANAIRGAEIPGIDVPQRFVTRRPRPDDVAAEAAYISSDELDAAIVAGNVGIHWSRTLLPEHIERYAFAIPRRASLAFYSANNAICRPGNVRPADALARALVIGAHAPEALRERRLAQRSPVLVRDDPDEARARLAEHADVVLSIAHVVAFNDAALEPVLGELVALVGAAASRTAERTP
jgi:ribose 1,5-bisphosphokinase PhnN